MARRLLLAVLIACAAAPAAAAAPALDRSYGRDGAASLAIRDTPTFVEALAALPRGGAVASRRDELVLLDRRGRVAGAARVRSAVIDTRADGTIGALRHDGERLILTRIAPGAPPADTALELPPEAYALALHARRGGWLALLFVHAQDGGYTQLIAGLQADGSLDAGFGDGGVVRLGRERGWTPSVIAQDRRRRILVVRQVALGRKLGWRVTRRGADGARDPRFRPTTITAGPRAYGLGGIAADGRSRPILAFSTTKRAIVARLKGSGGVDRRFGRNGRASLWRSPRDLTTPVVAAGRIAVGAALWDRDETTPHAHAWIVDARRGRRSHRVRLHRPTRAHPGSEVVAIARGGRGRVLLGGARFDAELDVFAREDYGRPHARVWRVRLR